MYHGVKERNILLKSNALIWLASLQFNCDAAKLVHHVDDVVRGQQV